jgi:tRNA U55 pseudouridine synthase TruB
MINSGIKNIGIWNKGEERIEELVKGKIKLLIGKRREKYPAYSSKTVDGKPLFEYTREGNIDDIEIPEREIEIYSVDFLGTQEISLDELIATAINRIKKVKGDFRQKEIISSWDNLLKLNSNFPNSNSSNNFQIIKLRVKSSSGAYMRTLAEKIGDLLGVNALAWKIRRTKIGEYSL